MLMPCRFTDQWENDKGKQKGGKLQKNTKIQIGSIRRIHYHQSPQRTRRSTAQPVGTHLAFVNGHGLWNERKKGGTTGVRNNHRKTNALFYMEHSPRKKQQQPTHTAANDSEWMETKTNAVEGEDPQGESEMKALCICARILKRYALCIRIPIMKRYALWIRYIYTHTQANISGIWSRCATDTPATCSANTSAMFIQREKH